jgi:acetyltransferase-like isoleucine patch superfamily enzyme
MDLMVVKNVLHLIAMNVPHSSLGIPLYRLRGTKIGRKVGIAHGVYIEESRPYLVTIEDEVNIGPKAIIVAHDSSGHCIDESIPIQFGPVTIKKRAYIGAGAIILPGVTVGEGAIVAAGAVVTQDVLPRVIVSGVPARTMRMVDEKLKELRDHGKRH